MKRKSLVWLLLVYSICFVVSCSDGFGFSREPNPLSEMKCYKTFEEFAYTDFLPSTERWLPTEPWQVQTTMPNEYDGEYIFWDVQLVRYVNGIPEVWFKSWGSYHDEVPHMLVYYPESNDWKPISAQVEGSEILVSDLFLTSDGSILGKNSWFSDEQDSSSTQWPILSKYNEQTNQFELILEAPLISPFDEAKPYYVRTSFDDVNDIFWVANDDGFYTYEFGTNRTIKQANLQDFSVGTLTSVTDGTIYFTNLTDWHEVISPGSPELYDGFLMQFSPLKNEFLQLDVPDEPWPIVDIPIATKSNKLWIGSVGYLDLNENRWNLLIDPLDYYGGGSLAWPPAPRVMLEDDSGIVWFKVSHESRGGGMAWYDPETGEGCMFTNNLANIVEDKQQNLWMFADGKLYRL